MTPLTLLERIHLHADREKQIVAYGIKNPISIQSDQGSRRPKAVLGSRDAA